MSKNNDWPRIDKDFKSLIPPPTPDELSQLEENLKKSGCLSPLIVWKETGVLLDGHNRHEICGRLHIPYDCEEISLPDSDAAIEWMVKNQLGRRNLSVSQRGMMAARIANMKKGDNQHKKKEDTARAVSTAQKVAAKQADVSVDSLQRAKKVLDKGSPALVNAVDAGKITVNEAAKIAKLDKAVQPEVLDADPETRREIIKSAARVPAVPERVAREAEKSGMIADALRRNCGLAVILAGCFEIKGMIRKAFTMEHFKTLDADGKLKACGALKEITLMVEDKRIEISNTKGMI